MLGFNLAFGKSLERLPCCLSVTIEEVVDLRLGVVLADESAANLRVWLFAPDDLAKSRLFRA